MAIVLVGFYFAVDVSASIFNAETIPDPSGRIPEPGERKFYRILREFENILRRAFPDLSNVTAEGGFEISSLTSTGGQISFSWPGLDQIAAAAQVAAGARKITDGLAQAIVLVLSGQFNSISTKVWDETEIRNNNGGRRSWHYAEDYTRAQAIAAGDRLIASQSSSSREDRFPLLKTEKQRALAGIFSNTLLLLIFVVLLWSLLTREAASRRELLEAISTLREAAPNSGPIIEVNVDRQTLGDFAIDEPAPAADDPCEREDRIRVFANGRRVDC
jgi:hypothetical protein